MLYRGVVICSIFASTAASAIITSGIGTSSRSVNTDFAQNWEFSPPKGDEWCVSKVIDDHIRCSSVNQFYLMTPGYYNTVCSIGVTLTKVIKSADGTIALDNDYFSDEGHKVWAYDNDNSANFSIENLPAHGVKTVLNTMIHLANVFKSLDGIKGNLYEKLASGPEMVEALKSELKQKSCSNYKLSHNFTEKTVLKTTLHKIDDSCRTHGYGTGYKACGFKSYSETLQNISYPVNASTGKIDRSQPSNHSEIYTQKITDKFCESAEINESYAIQQCKNKAHYLNFQLQNQ